jgi:flagellin-like hook-associated protein FlgL
MSVSLSAGLRNSVNSVTDINSAIATANLRLATGRKINSALDNATKYFQAQGFQKDARDLEGLQDGFSLGLKVVDKGLKAYEGAKKNLEAAIGLARQATQLGATDAAGRNALNAQVAQLVGEAAKLLFDADFNGSRLLQTNATANNADLNVITNTATGASQTKIVVAKQDGRLTDGATGLGAFIAGSNVGVVVADAAGAAQTAAQGTLANQFSDVAAGNTVANAFITLATTAINTINSRSASLATSATSINIRSSFTADTRKILNTAADDLTLADINEEGANLTALQTRQQLAVTAMSLAGRTDQAILRLF